MLWFTFNPGLTLTGFETTRPWLYLFNPACWICNVTSKHFAVDLRKGKEHKIDYNSFKNYNKEL